MFSPGDQIFVECSDYPCGGYPVVFVENDSRRKECSIVLCVKGEVSSFKQVVPNNMLRELSPGERELFSEELVFLGDSII